MRRFSPKTSPYEAKDVFALNFAVRSERYFRPKLRRARRIIFRRVKRRSFRLKVRRARRQIFSAKRSPYEAKDVSPKTSPYEAKDIFAQEFAV